MSLNEKTATDYRKLADHFYRTRLPGQPPTPKRLADALRSVAPDYRPAYWRRLRNAIEFDQRRQGYEQAADRVAATQNPVTTDASRYGEIKQKQSRIRRVRPEEHQALRQELLRLGHRQSVAVLEIVRLTGCRPAESPSITVGEDGGVHITGVKRRADRGIDRTIYFSEDETAYLRRAINYLQRHGGPVEAVRRARHHIDQAARRLWPARRARPSMYSYRHQMGADLKASGMDRREVAAVMGHLSQSSVDVYGKPRCASGRRSVRASADSIARVQDKGPKPMQHKGQKNTEVLSPAEQLAKRNATESQAQAEPTGDSDAPRNRQSKQRDRGRGGYGYGM